MKAGGGKQKGADFERLVCKDLSRALTAGTRDDLFWRSAMSGGRATITNRRAKGPKNKSQLGDISCISPEGAWLTDEFTIECKFYKDLLFDTFLLERAGPIAQFWQVLTTHAKANDRRPLLILRENRREPMVMMNMIDRDDVRYVHPDLVEPGWKLVHLNEMVPVVRRVYGEDDLALYWYQDFRTALTRMLVKHHQDKRQRL